MEPPPYHRCLDFLEARFFSPFQSSTWVRVGVGARATAGLKDGEKKVVTFFCLVLNRTVYQPFFFLLPCFYEKSCLLYTVVLYTVVLYTVVLYTVVLYTAVPDVSESAKGSNVQAFSVVVMSLLGE